jgi:hypothetical protein
MADTRAAPVILPLVRGPADPPSAVPGADACVRPVDR